MIFIPNFPIQPKTLILFLEGVLASFLFLKILVSTLVVKVFKKGRIKEGYWFYLYFAIFYILYITLHIIKNLYFEGPLDILSRPKFNPILIDYFKNIFFMGCFPCLMIFCYKTAMDNPNTDFYTGNVGKKQKDSEMVYLCRKFYYFFYSGVHGRNDSFIYVFGLHRYRTFAKYTCSFSLYDPFM